MSEKVTVTQDMVDRSIAKIEDFKIGAKTTIVLITMVNGFEVTGESACIDPANYVHEIGVKYATERAKSKIWGFLAYELQERQRRFEVNKLRTAERINQDMQDIT